MEGEKERGEIDGLNEKLSSAVRKSESQRLKADQVIVICKTLYKSTN